MGNPFRMGNSVARADDFECLDWNKNVPHIMVTGSSGGFVTVWDVKTKKESLTLNNLGRKAVSAVAWDPDKVIGYVKGSDTRLTHKHFSIPDSSLQSPTIPNHLFLFGT